MALIADTWQAVDMVADRLTDKSGLLGLRFVGKYDEKRIPQYPAVVIIPGPRSKQLHNIGGSFNIDIQLELYICHGDLTLSKRERSKEDMKLVASVEDELESDYIWKSNPSDPSSGQVIFAYVSEDEFGLLMPRANKSNTIISTKVTWRALTQRGFDE